MNKSLNENSTAYLNYYRLVQVVCSQSTAITLASRTLFCNWSSYENKTQVVINRNFDVL